MKYYTSIIFYELFIFLEATKPRTVNLALQTVLEFDRNNNSGDLRMIDKATDFLNDLKKDITEKLDRFDRGHDDKVKHRVHVYGKRHKHEPKVGHIEERYKFTDFVKDTLEVLTTYDDDNLNEAVKAIADEINKYSAEKRKIHKFLDTPHFRRTMSQNIESLNHASAQDLRNKLNTIVYMIDMDLFTDRQRHVIDFINSLYGQEPDAEFKNLIHNLRQYGRKSKRSNFSLTELIQNGITAILDQYSKRISRTNIKALWKYSDDNEEHNKDCTVFFCPMMFPFFNNEESVANGKVNKTRNKISNSSTKVKVNKEHRNDNDRKIDSMIERIKKKEINKKVADLFDTIDGKKGKKKRKRHHARQTDVKENNVDIAKKTLQKTLLVSNKLKEKIKNSASRFITLYEEAITEQRKYSARRKTTRMAENVSKKRKNKKSMRINMRDSKPRNNIVYEHDAAIEVHRPRTVLSEEHHLTQNLPKQSVTSKIRTQGSVMIKQPRKALNTPSPSSDEGLTIESFENAESIRRSFKNEPDDHKNKSAVLSQTNTGNILNRLTNLEKGLDDVKKQISEVNLRKKGAETDDTSIERESIESEIEDKNDKTTKILVNRNTTPKVTTLGIDKYLRFRSLDNEFDNKLNDSIESNEVMPILNDTFDRISESDHKYEVKPNTTTAPYTIRFENMEENRQGFESSDILEKNTTQKRNRIDNKDKNTLSVALDKMQNESNTKLKLNKNADYKNMTKLEKLTSTTYQTFTGHKLGDKFKIVDKKNITPLTLRMVEANPDLTKKTFKSDLDKLFNETDKIDFDDTLIKKLI